MKTPRPYQSAAADVLAVHNVILADQCGLGKTFTAILSIVRKERHPLWRGLIVCPLRIMDQWVTEIEDADPEARITKIPYGIPFSVYFHTAPYGWFVTYYEALRTNLHVELAHYTWDVIIADEAHRLKNRRTQQTLALKRIPAARKIALTGTPMEKNHNDLWSILNWIDPPVFSSYWKFHDRYTEFIMDKYTGYRKDTGVKNGQQLAKLLKRFMIQRNKEDVAPELPPKVISRVPLSMTEKQREAYLKIKNADDIVVDIGAPDPLLIVNALAKITRLQQITSDPVMLGVEAESAKIEWVHDWLQDNPSAKAVIFTRFRHTAEVIQKRFGGVLIVGGVKTVPQHWDMVVGTIDAMGEGLNLQAADYAIFVDQHWSTIKMQQAIDRIHRMGITSTKFIYYLICKGTVDYTIAEAIENKWDEIRFIYEAMRS